MLQYHYEILENAGENFMKKAIPKLLIFFYLIPLAVSVLFVGLSALFGLLWLDLASLPDWLLNLPYPIGYFCANFALFATFGIFAYYICHEKAWKSFMFVGFTVLFAALIPVCHYLITHIVYMDAMDDLHMFEFYNENVTMFFIYLMNLLIFLLATLSVRAAFAFFIMKKPPNPKNIFSPKHPVGLSTILFSAVALCMATLIFINDQIFTLDAFLTLGKEYLINLAQFAAIILGAAAARKWNGKAPEKNPQKA
jgi:hypothetical protein